MLTWVLVLIWSRYLNAGAIYGNTLRDLVDSGAADGDKPILKIVNPYPDYNSDTWKETNAGTYHPCNGYDGQPVKDLMAYKGHAKAFEEPTMGSYTALGIESNLCYERETRLWPFGHLEDSDDADTSMWDNINWGHLQDQCVQGNSDRYVPVTEAEHARYNATTGQSDDETELGKRSQHETRTDRRKTKARSAVLIRTWTGNSYTDNDRQAIRSLVTELSLRSGGEYQVYLLLHVKNNTLPIFENATLYDEVIRDNIPQEFWNMTVLWQESNVAKLYPLIPEEAQNVHRAQYLPVQKFAIEHPQFDYFWNWEVDARYVGQTYELLEKLSSFSAAQPRKYLWERSNRFYIPSYHGDYNTKFRESIENEYSDSETIWGPVPLEGIIPTGPTPFVSHPKEDEYDWGVGEEADYISLTPIFNPVGTNWIIRFDVWGYQGEENTPRRTAIGTQSRTSRRMLKAMHIENLKGNHVASEMVAETVAMYHGLKALYAPLPVFFDRPWEPKSLNRYFNPGPRGESGSVGDSPFSYGNEDRFKGCTWYYRATPPQRLYNHFLGWEDTGIGGPEVCVLVFSFPQSRNLMIFLLLSSYWLPC
jgi:hypothetical protein